MIRRRQLRTPRIAVFGVIALAWVVAARPNRAADTLPSRIGDSAFWQLVTEMSEPNGYFRSDNFLSNENAFQYVIPELKQHLQRGGVYLGVGPEQNFTYIAALQPKVAFIIDIRRQNMVEQLLYKAFFEASSNRIEFLSHLFGRKAPTDIASDAGVDALFEAFKKAPASDELFQQNLAAVRERLGKHHGFSLTPDDVKSLEYVYHAFFDAGPELSYSFNLGGGPSFGWFPTYADLMTETDSEGKQRSFLASEEAYRTLRELEQNNVIVPITGDFGGEKALRAVGRYLKEHGATVSAFYTSNVEQYLFQSDEAWKRFFGNVATLPLDSHSTFIRSVSGRAGFQARPSMRATTRLASMEDVVKAFNEGRIQGYYDVVSMSR